MDGWINTILHPSSYNTQSVSVPTTIEPVWFPGSIPVCDDVCSDASEDLNYLDIAASFPYSSEGYLCIWVDILEHQTNR
jgi:hypothetical protein